MISCGIQCLNCDYPIHMDTYQGCSHECKYCFVRNRKHYSLDEIKPLRSKRGLREFINGKRNDETKWCDWDIPLHWGGNSDPFQECELEHKVSLECLEIFAETGYPFIISTKNPVMLTKEPYLSLIEKCNCVLQISMACSVYDNLETGAPTYNERLKAAEKLSDRVKRIIARIRPYFPDCHKQIVNEFANMKQAGIYGISVSSYISPTAKKGMERVGSMYVYPLELMEPKFRDMKQRCHEAGLRWFCCERGLDHTSDDLTCCGTEGLDGFIPSTYNIAHLAYESAEPTKAMCEVGTQRPFKCVRQSQSWAMTCKGKSYAELMHICGDDKIEWCKEMQRRYSW